MHIAKKFSQKTLVITHTASLRDQWAEEVEALFGCKPGIIGGGKLDYEDHFITIANVQTLVKHTDRLAKEFGTIILDEAHHCPATTFAAIVDTFYARYRIALSGTMQRKDLKHIVFPDYFGHQVFKPPVNNTLVPEVLLLSTNLTLKPEAPWTEKITDLVQNPGYRKLVAAIAVSEMAAGHQVLVIADRVDFLKALSDEIGEACVLVTGEQDTEARKVAKDQLLSREKMCVAGSRQIFSEGISINTLSCVILAVPLSNDSLLEQIVGRVQRKAEGKLEPLVIDLQFAGWESRKQNESRMGFYMRKGWKMRKH